MSTTVTITGADDEVDPCDLLKLSHVFPFVEWGILFSTRLRGSARYPTDRWVRRLVDVFVGAKTPLRVARHLCGQASRETMLGSDVWLGDMYMYDRVQLNGYTPGHYWGELRRLAERYGTRFILQCRFEDMLQECAHDAARIPGASVLFDGSGGRGISPLRWPPTPSGCRIGFAGGLGPDNVIEEICAIGPRDPYWIDMEARVRNDRDRLDISNVRSVLKQIADCGCANGTEWQWHTCLKCQAGAQ